MEIKDKTQRKIIEFATNKIFTRGYSNVSIADFASELKISKSTFYKYFASKEALLYEVLKHFFRKIEAEFDEILANPSLHLIDQIKQLLFTVSQRVAKIDTPAIHDLKRAMPEAYVQFDEHRKNLILNKLAPLFQKGVKQGYFREDLDQTLVIAILMNAIQTLANPEFLANTPYTFHDVFKHISTLIIEGNLTAKGRKQFHA
ncbi:TetR/AcrR family transcriptional regulator [Paenactinomyces guangxiensis]|uniref:TetR/AcrR family transcriptional regulator n=1 Tax=Paenactinomyces guangxiensis TaxID=1490290 RepID=A0A7W2A9F6_9BACL|nr:TetR/AcrR family transcriptional regulator [Paenactinomyces guangxiensis]MBA4495199.1 TetR/AcrR family transcriptional regulator [Paenactinomyces guangxiensis]MBH8592283.1 TetR/AcrR family transcriptional regulator [Paenactinomyces guangxiensis]